MWGWQSLAVEGSEVTFRDAMSAMGSVLCLPRKAECLIEGKLRERR